ncbi:MAG: hypothetical protein VKJ04_08760 [Vampirovibrionales bacterium]|nr:hypothetical protein [Vampirovibrionales bacterium]
MTFNILKKTMPAVLLTLVLTSFSGGAFAAKANAGQYSNQMIQGSQIAEIGTEKQTYHEMKVQKGSTTSPGASTSTRQEVNTQRQSWSAGPANSGSASVTSTTRQREMTRQLTPQSPAEEAQQESAR